MLCEAQDSGMMKEKISGEPGTYAGQQQHNLKIARKVCTFIKDIANKIDNSFARPGTARPTAISAHGFRTVRLPRPAPFNSRFRCDARRLENPQHQPKTTQNCKYASFYRRAPASSLFRDHL